MQVQPTKILICGSLAMDHLLRHSGSFKTYQETYEVEAMNASLPISEYRTCFGGCGGNIAYGLGILGVPTVLLSHAGRDFLAGYQQHLSEYNIDCSYVAVDPKAEFSARCTILGDDFGNQITGFYPGFADAGLRTAADQVCLETGADFALLGPEAPELMLKQAAELDRANISFVFDPGQWISEFDKTALNKMLGYRPWIFGNTHELDVMTTLLSSDVQLLAERSDVVLRTRGAAGLDLYLDGSHHLIEAAQARAIVDTTGSGDAFRAGFLFGLHRGFGLKKAAQFGSLTASRSVEHRDPQGWSITIEELLAN